MQNKNKIIILILVTFLITCTFSGCKMQYNDSAFLQMHVFSCGKADAILLMFDGYNVLIDTGEHGDGEEIVQELVSLKVKKIDLMILTHHDKDHIGGADTILDNFPVSTVRLPDYEEESKQYTQLMTALNNSDAKVIRMKSDDSFALGQADFTIWVSTIPYNGKNDNEQSLVTKIRYGGKTFLLMGDAENSWLKELCFSSRNLTCDVMKLPHHGVYDKNLITLFAVTMPEYVLITDSVKNPAEDDTLSLLNTFECKTFRTANGTIHLYLNNIIITVEQ